MPQSLSFIHSLPSAFQSGLDFNAKSGHCASNFGALLITRYGVVRTVCWVLQCLIIQSEMTFCLRLYNLVEFTRTSRLASHRTEVKRDNYLTLLEDLFSGPGHSASEEPNFQCQKN